MSGRLVPRNQSKLVPPVSNKSRQPGASLATRHTASSLQKYANNAAERELKDVLERKIEDLSRQLAQEKQTSRQNKLAASRLQREATRSKNANRPIKEQLSKELEHEKMLRAEAEHRLQEMTKESDNCRSRLASLQDEFRKMEDMVRDMVQYKSKIDQLKQEKSSLSSSYEIRLDKFQSHITELERENILLLNEVKKMESQMNHKHDVGSPDRSRVLLERLRMLEGENSSLVLENEQQRGQYETCLDEIANQVVQALLAQKMLREECLKLQNRVHDLEHQNRQLCTIVQHKIKMSQDNPNQMAVEGEEVLTQGSIDSLQSIFSEQMSEHLATLPHPSSPSQWLQERLSGDRRSIASLTGSVMSTPELNLSSNTGAIAGFSCRTKIETEFPATPSSPKSKHVNVVEKQNETKRSASVSSLTSHNRGPTKQRTRSTSSLSRVRGLSFLSPPERSQSNESGIQHATTNELSANNSRSSTEKSIDSIVPFNQSNPSITSTPSLSSQGQVSNVGSKIPGVQLRESIKDESRLRRNSLKAEYGIRMGCQSPVSKTNSASPTLRINTVSSMKQPSSTRQGSRSPSVSSVGSQGNSRSPSVSSTKSNASSKIPQIFRNSVSNLSKADSKENVSTQGKGKSVSEKQTNTSKIAIRANSSQSKLIPPRSPTLRYSGIRTTLKTDSLSKPLTSKADTTSVKRQTFNNSMTTPANIKSVYTINPSANRQSLDRQIKGTSKPPIPSRIDKAGVTNRPETNYPIMGLTNLSHTSPKNEDSPKVYANVFSATQSTQSSVKKTVSAIPNGNSGDISALKQAQYFYDYSDEDSDANININRPVSKDFSIASSVSLDELLDQTLENIETPVDGNFSSLSSDQFLFSLKEVPLNTKSGSSNRSSVDREENVKRTPPFDSVDGAVRSGIDMDNASKLVRLNSVGSSKGTQNIDSKTSNKESMSRMSGKPDIVKDTEKCEQRNLQKSITASQIPGSSMPGYRAKRPKSLVLGAKDKRFLYCEYGSSSSPDTSDEEWSYQLSYAKNIKQQEIQSKVAKSLQSGQAKLIESPNSLAKTSENTNSNKLHRNTTINKVSPGNSEKQGGNNKTVSQIPKGSLLRKPSKVPPPVASKPVSKRNIQNGNVITRPKSVEICVNTVLASTHDSVTCFSYLNKSESKPQSVKCLNESVHNTTGMLFSTKSEDPELTLNSTFDEVKVERSGSKDDGYSTMSSDVQPEIMEKYSDVFESSTNSNDIRNSNLSLSSQNSYSSEERPSSHSSIGRVRAMKMKYDIENQKSPEREAGGTKSPSISPSKSALKPPKPAVLAKPSTTSNASSDKTVSLGISRIPKSKPTKENVPVNKGRSAIPVPKTSSLPVKKDIVKDNQTRSNTVPASSKDAIPTKDTFIDKVTTDTERTPCKTEFNTIVSQVSCMPQTSTPIRIDEQFDNLGYFTPAFDRIEFLRDTSCDSNSSLSDRGSDLTSLHISEDNMLSDIPEEKEGYESSVGHRSGHTSFSSIPNVTMGKKTSQAGTHNSHVQHHAVKFTNTRKNHWSSLQGLCRAARVSDYMQQKELRKSADYEELYGGCLNIETLNERSTSESELYNRGDKPEVTLLPRLQRSHSAGTLDLDELAVEEQVQDVLKAEMVKQIQKNVNSADKDEANFSSFVELLIQRGHVMSTASSPIAPGKTNKEESPGLNKMSVSNLSSKVNTPNVDHFVVSEEKRGAEVAASQNSSAVTTPVGEEQKKFNSQFYSLCNTGSVKSISDKSDRQWTEMKSGNSKNAKSNARHSCQKGEGGVSKSGEAECVICIEEKNVVEFDDISRQIESLSKTVNALHKSLTSLNSDNSDSGSESNEGDSVLMSAIGNKDIDGYHWVEDEFFLSPYGGEAILGGSPFSDTGASCEWMNEYPENSGHFEELGGHEALHEEPLHEYPVPEQPSLNPKPTRHGSILAGSLDKEGNFDSKRFISQRLREEEMKRRAQNGTSNAQNDNGVDGHIYAVPIVITHRPNRVQGQNLALRKEELRITPEKDVDETESFNEQRHRRGDIADKMVGYGGSQDSLDDNIGVDNMMCHRLLGGKGPSEAVRNTPYSRPPLDFSNKQFIRFGDHEKDAVAAFDFLNEMATSHISDESNGPKPSHDHFLNGGRNSTRMEDINRMTQSTTSNESRASPVKRNRRKLRPKTHTSQKTYANNGASKNRKLSSTSADSNLDSDADVSFSDSFCDSYSSSEEETVCQSAPTRPKTMTYI